MYMPRAICVKSACEPEAWAQNRQFAAHRFSVNIWRYAVVGGVSICTSSSPRTPSVPIEALTFGVIKYNYSGIHI
jgi:hypothetical protein